MRTWVYVDAFNLYYGCLKGTPHKWLNLLEFCQQHLARENKVERIKYCTADVSANVDPASPGRQRTYLNALGTLDEVEVVKGSFLFTTRKARLSEPAQIAKLGTEWVTVHKIEEKGSDVNLATHMVLDACSNRFDVAVVVSNDSDLAEPLRIVRREFGKIVGLLCPYPKPSEALRQHASFVRHVTSARLAKSQFPREVRGIDGRRIIRPASW